MIIRFRDRIRLLAGVKQISIDAVLPIILLPILFGLASISFYSMIVICVVMPLLLGYAQWFRKMYAPKTKFFFMWSMWSAIYLWILFEMTVPLLELLPEENFIFITTMFLAIFCFYKTRQKAAENFVAPHTDGIGFVRDEDQTLLAMDDEDADECDLKDNISDSGSDSIDYRLSQTNNVCPKCHRYIPPRAFHCQICQQCIAKRDHHSVWLDCCIGESNHKYFLCGCIFAMFALLFGANLSMTSICHPFFVFRIFSISILLPDDCSDVFDQYDIALCFVGSIYATVMAICCILILMQQCYLIMKGVTASEWSRGEINRNGCLINLKTFVCCAR